MSAKFAFSQSLREVRFLFCQTSADSNATRTFLGRAYPTMKKNNPHIPIMLREAYGTHPRIYARFGWFNSQCTKRYYVSVYSPLAEFGEEKSASLEGLSENEIEERVSGLVHAGK